MSDVERKQMEPLLVEKSVKKHDCILNEGQVCDFFIYIKRGSFRTFNSANLNGDVMNVMLNYTNDIIGNMESYVTQQKSNVCIQAIESSDIIFIFKKDLDALYQDSLYWNKFGRKLTENVFIESKLRHESLLYYTPEQRYLNILETKPEFL